MICCGSTVVYHLYYGLDDHVVNIVNTFADDTRISSIVVRREGYLSLQHDLDQVQKWTKEWQMELHVR